MPDFMLAHCHGEVCSEVSKDYFCSLRAFAEHSTTALEEMTWTCWTISTKAPRHLPLALRSKCLVRIVLLRGHMLCSCVTWRHVDLLR